MDIHYVIYKNQAMLMEYLNNVLIYWKSLQLMD